MSSPVQRNRIANVILALGPDKLTNNASFRHLLNTYVESGDVHIITNSRIRSMIEHVEAMNPQEMSQPEINRAVRDSLSRYLGYVVKDPSARQFSRDLIDDAPLTSDSDAIRAEVAESMFDYMQAQMPDHPQAQQAFNALTETWRSIGADIGNINQEAFLESYAKNYVRSQFPHLTPQESQRAIAEYKAIMPELGFNVQRSFIPEGCMIPLAFVLLFTFLSAIMGILLLLLAGQALLPLFWQTEVGQALNATIFFMSLMAGLYLWLRQQRRSAGIIRLFLLVMFMAGGGLLVVQLLSIEADSVQAASSDTNSTISVLILGMTVISSIVLWLRRRALNLIWTGLFLGLFIVLMILASQSGLLDLNAIDLSGLFGSDAGTSTPGFE